MNELSIYVIDIHILYFYFTATGLGPPSPVIIDSFFFWVVNFLELFVFLYLFIFAAVNTVVCGLYSLVCDDHAYLFHSILKQFNLVAATSGYLLD